MMSIAFKEGIKNLSSVLNEIILASNQDVRQVKNCRDGVINNRRCLR